MPDVNKILNIPREQVWSMIDYPEYTESLPQIPLDIPTLAELENNPKEEYYRNTIGMPRPGNIVAEIFAHGFDPQTGLPNADKAGPVLRGITGNRNAQKILEQIRATGASKPVEIAVEFAKRKYPMLAGLVNNVLIKDPIPNRKFLYGSHNTDSGVVRVYNHGKSRKLQDYVDTVVHEIEHGRQKARMAEADLEDSRYITSRLPDKILNSIKNPLTKQRLIDARYSLYRNQPVEKQSEKAGEIGAKAYDDFMEQLFPTTDKVFNFYSQLTKKNSKDVKSVIDYLFDESIKNSEDLNEINRLNIARTQFIDDVDNLVKSPKKIKIVDILPKNNKLYDKFANALTEYGFTGLLGKNESLRIVDESALVNELSPRKAINLKSYIPSFPTPVEVRRRPRDLFDSIEE